MFFGLLSVLLWHDWIFDVQAPLLLQVFSLRKLFLQGSGTIRKLDYINVSDTGQLSIVSGVVLDFETYVVPQHFVLIIQVNNTVEPTRTVTGTITVSIQDVEEAPVFDRNSPQGNYFVLNEFEVSIHLENTEDSKIQCYNHNMIKQSVMNLKPCTAGYHLNFYFQICCDNFDFSMECVSKFSITLSNKLSETVSPDCLKNVFRRLWKNAE